MGDTLLSNAINQVIWEDGTGQVIICACGVSGCQSGGWVALRRVGDLGLLLPAFTLMENVAEELRFHYGPTDYLFRSGGLYFEVAQYEKLRQLTALPEFGDLPTLTGWEAVKLYQLEAPARVLGHIEIPSALVSDVVLASSIGNFIEQVPQLQHLLATLPACESVRLRQISPSETPISFYLDVAGIPSWVALVETDRRLQLYLQPGFVIEEN